MSNVYMSEDFLHLETLNYMEQLPYISSGFLRASQRPVMGFVLLYGKKTISKYGFRRSVLETTRRPVSHVLLQKCAGKDAMDEADCSAQLAEAAELLTTAGYHEYLPQRWAKEGSEDRFWQKAAAGFPVHSVYDLNDLPNYASYDYRDCPYCKAGRRLDALVNSFGYSSL